jgi:hypothetical protein
MRDPPHVDWIGTMSGFDRAQFEKLWGDMGEFVSRDA